MSQRRIYVLRGLGLIGLGILAIILFSLFDDWSRSRNAARATAFYQQHFEDALKVRLVPPLQAVANQQPMCRSNACQFLPMDHSGRTYRDTGTINVVRIWQLSVKAPGKPQYAIIWVRLATPSVSLTEALENADQKKVHALSDVTAFIYSAEERISPSLVDPQLLKLVTDIAREAFGASLDLALAECDRRGFGRSGDINKDVTCRVNTGPNVLRRRANAEALGLPPMKSDMEIAVAIQRYGF